MELKAVRFYPEQDGKAISALAMGQLLALPDELLGQAPGALAISNSDLNALTLATEQISHLGKKDHRKGLATYLVERKTRGIPAIDGAYNGIGQACNGIRKLLNRAVKEQKNTLFLIGLTDELFLDLWDKHMDGPVDGPTDPTPLAGPPDDEPIPPLGLNLAHLFEHVQVPDALEKAYLGNSLEAQMVRKMIVLASQSAVPVLILGPTGSGKEKVAQLIHEYSERRNHHLITVNCGAIPENLLESELFGHVKGAFTGATADKIGKWQLADRGTLFLDEIGDMLPVHQVKLLRALESNTIQPVGGTKDIKVNARIIAATNKDLFTLVNNDQFREDLFYRLQHFKIRTPSITTNTDDLSQMVPIFWRRICRDPQRMLPKDVIAAFGSRSWPGNVRQVMSMLNQLYALFGKKPIRKEHFDAVLILEGNPPPESPGGKRPSNERVNVHLAACLQHLRRVDEAVHATMASLGDAMDHRDFDAARIDYVADILRHQLNEMELLFQHPRLFGGDDTFRTVSQLKGRLTYFENLIQKKPIQAKRYWDQEVQVEFGRTLSVILEAIEHTIEQV